MDVSLSPLLGMAVEILTIVILAIGAWAGTKLAGYFGVEAESDTSIALHDGIDRAIHFAMQKVADRGEGITVNVKNEVVANALNYILENFPGTIKQFGLNEKRIADLILGHLPFLPGDTDG